jgi:hypothetical protein
MNEMMDMMHAGTPYEAGPHGDLEHALSAGLPKNSREAEKAIRLALVKLHAVIEWVPQSAIGTIPAIGACFGQGHFLAGTIGVGVFIASGLASMLATKRVGATDIQAMEDAIKYLDKKGYPAEASVQYAIEEILDKEGY